MQSNKYSHLLAPVVCVLLAPAFASAQNAATFNILTSNAQSESPGNIYAVDVNNDGLTDIVSDGGYSPAAFYVSINNGDGTFAAPVEYTLPSSDQNNMCVAAGDYNHDGNVDLAVPLVSTNQIAVYLGNGDGTFRSSIISTINFADGSTFDQQGCAAADFNADGNVDLVAWGAGHLDVFQGLGNGSFDAAPHAALFGFSSIGGNAVFVGDYDGDGKTDIATSADNGSNGTTVHVAYGNNDFSFLDTTPYTYNGLLYIGSGDLNSDGITDLYALTNYSPSPQQLGALYGTPSRTFTSYWIDTPAAYWIRSGQAAQPWMSQLTMGDYNGDGRMDLAAMAQNPSTGQQDVAIFLAGSHPGEFTTQTVALNGAYDFLTDPVAGLFSGGRLKPDVTFNASNNGSDDTTPTFLPALLNTTSGNFGPCTYPTGSKGLNVCVPGAATENFAQFSAAANSLGQLRKIELWVDGKKVQEQDHTWDAHAYFDWTGRFSKGTHQATFYAYDVDNTAQRYDFNFTINDN